MAKKILFILILCLFSLIPACGIAQSDTEQYLLAFAEEDTGRIRVRTSKDGIVWEDAGFRDANTSLGVGAAADYSGLVQVVAWMRPPLFFTGNQMEFTLGLVDEFEEKISYETTQYASSAPSAIYGVNGKSWIFAYAAANNDLSVRIYNQETNQFLDMDCAPIEDVQTNLLKGRPALTRMGDKILLAWSRNPGTYNASDEIWIAEGTISPTEIGCPTWNSKFQFTTSNNSEGQSCKAIMSAPALTHTEDQFYLGYIKKCPSNPLGNAVLFLHSSANGLSWGEPSIKNSVPGTLGAYLDMAGNSDGTVLIAIKGLPFVLTQPIPPVVFSYHQDSWSDVDAGSVFGYSPADEQFSLVTTGHPALSSPAP